MSRDLDSSDGIPIAPIEDNESLLNSIEETVELNKPRRMKTH